VKLCTKSPSCFSTYFYRLQLINREASAEHSILLLLVICFSLRSKRSFEQTWRFIFLFVKENRFSFNKKHSTRLKCKKPLEIRRIFLINYKFLVFSLQRKGVVSMKATVSSVESSIIYDIIERHSLSRRDAHRLFRKRKLSKSKYKKYSNKEGKAYKLWKMYLSN
jgi:hypothetical protein